MHGGLAMTENRIKTIEASQIMVTEGNEEAVCDHVARACGSTWVLPSILLPTVSWP